MESLTSDYKDSSLIILPSGKQFIRKTFSQYTDDEIKEIIAQCNNISHMLTTLKVNSCYHYKIKNFIENNNISIAHFKTTYYSKAHNNNTIRSNTAFKRQLINEEKLVNKCAICNLETLWNNKPIMLQLDHINGDHFNNDIINLRLLCPNCHSQTDTYTGRNIKRSNEHIIKSNNIEVESNNIKTKLVTIKPKLVTIKPKKENNKTEIDLNILNTEANLTILEVELQNIKKEIFKNKLICPKVKPTCTTCHTELTQKRKTGLCEKCVKISFRSIERPSYSDLIKELNENNFTQTGKKYGVSDNAIRKWIKYYEKNMD